MNISDRFCKENSRDTNKTFSCTNNNTATVLEKLQITNIILLQIVIQI